jgi:ribonuclease R
MRAALRGERIDKSERALEALRAAAVTASECERKAMEVEREVMDLYRALFMRSKIGSILEGTVTGFVGTGVFVAVDSPFVDVLVRMDELGPDQYTLDDDGLRVVGMRSGDRISLGDPMLVEIEDVAILRRTVYGRRVIDPEERRFAKARSKGRRDAERASASSASSAPSDRKKRSAAGAKRAKGETKRTKSTARAKGGKKRRLK